VSGESEPSERGSAIMTLPDVQNAPYSVASTEFGHSGFTLTQLKRAGDVAIYKQSKRKQPAGYEVVVLRPYEAWTSFGKDFPAGEQYPKSEDWGTYGFTYRTIEAAERKFRELTASAKEIA
jgi:hypothetical protein